MKAEYYKTRRFNQGDRVLERIDPVVAFDFADKSPIGDKIDPHEFAIRWEGSVLAPETGEYEFVVRTDHAMKLWVNDPRRPLIDALVKSGNDNEYRGSIFLLGGRSYGAEARIHEGQPGRGRLEEGQAEAARQGVDRAPVEGAGGRRPDDPPRALDPRPRPRGRSPSRRPSRPTTAASASSAGRRSPRPGRPPRPTPPSRSSTT